MRLCPRCHTLHPDRDQVCHSDVCGDVGTPLVTGEVAAPPRRLERTSAMDEAARDDGIGALDELSRDDASRDDVSRDELSRDDDDVTGGGARAPGSRQRPARTAALLPPGKRPHSVAVERKSARDSRAEDAIGRVLGSYKLLEVIGRGGMGRVYRAEHVRLGRHVALKLLKPEYAVKRDAVARFFQEAKAVNKIRHRNIVEVTDYVELENGTTFIIMELLEGASLGKALRLGGPMETARLLAILVQVCDALEAAHAVGIVHRDLKPDNIFLIQEDIGEVAKLLDFGVAKLLTGDDDSSADQGWQTAAGSVVGTPAYMSPEQAGGLEVDGRSDVYSTGAIMYELFCGQPVFRGRSFGDFVVKHMSEPVVPPRDTPGGAAIAPELEQIILRCLAKKPADRYASVGELRDRLYQHLASIDSGLGLVISGPRGSGVRSLAGSGPIRLPQASGTPASSLTPGPSGPVPSGDTLPSVPGFQSGGPLPGLPPTPLPRSVVEGDAESPSSNGFDTRMVLGDLRGAPPSTERRKPRATWPLWTAGAAALAIGAFLIATGVGRDPVAPPPPFATEPTVQPLAPAPAVPPRSLLPVKLSVRTDPVGADVYVYGSDDSQCRTPCELIIDPGDGGSTTKRVFTLKRPGFQDYQLEVPLGGTPPPDAFVILMPEGDTDQATPPPAGEPVVEHSSEKPGRVREHADTPHAAEEVKPRTPTPPAPPVKDDKDDKGDKAAPPPEGKPDETKATPDATPAKTEPPPAKKKDKIDRADTLDPFGKK